MSFGTRGRREHWGNTLVTFGTLIWRDNLQVNQSLSGTLSKVVMALSVRFYFSFFVFGLHNMYNNIISGQHAKLSSTFQSGPKGLKGAKMVNPSKKYSYLVLEMIW